MCPYEEKLTAWLLGDLIPQEQAAVTRHLAACAACRATRDELAAVLTPLKGGLAKDSRFSRPPAKRPRRGLAAFLYAPWVRAAALLIVSFSTLIAMFGFLYNAATGRKEPVGPITTVTFHKQQDLPPEPLEPFPAPAENIGIAPVPFEPYVLLPSVAHISIPEIPMREYDLPYFLAFAPLALWASSSNMPPVVYNDLLAQQRSASAATNTGDNIPSLQPPPYINATPKGKR